MSLRRAGINIGIIGCGLIAETQHLPALMSLPGVRTTALADTNLARAAQVAERFQIARCFTDYQALLADNSIDIVAVCVPVRFHAPVCLAALDAGKHVFIEKPLALTLAECRQIEERAARSPKNSMVGFNLRWHPLVREAREMVRSGALGRIEAIRTVFSSGSRYRACAPEWRKRRNLGGGALIEVGIHHYDLWRYLSASEVAEISVASRSAEWDDQTVSLSGRMADGTCISSLFTVASASDNEVQVYGEKGRLSLSLYRFDGLEFLPSGHYLGDLGIRASRWMDVFRRLPGALPPASNKSGMVRSYRNQWEHFIACLRGGTRPECSVEDGKRAMEIAWAALESSRCNTPVQVAHD